MRLEVVPINLREANEFVRRHHRHHRPVRGHKFSIAVARLTDQEPCGVAIVGRPVSRMLDNGWTLEVLRVCTDGTKNACSKLYAHAWRAARAMGYKRLVTYTLDHESGGSIRAAGWRLFGVAGGGSWDCPSRPRVDMHPTQRKFRWEVATP